MPDDESDDQRSESAGVEPQGDSDGQPSKGPATSQRRTRRPRPAPTSGYVPGRRPRVEETHTMNPYIVPVVALVALLALLIALVVAKVHNSNTASSGPTATVTEVRVSPSATPRATSTPVKVATPLTTKAGVAAEVNGESIPMGLYVHYSDSAIVGLQQDHQDQQTGATIKAIDVRTAAGKAAVKQTRQQVLDSLIQNYMIVAYARDHHLLPTQLEITTVISGYYSQGGGKDAFMKLAQTEGFTADDVHQIAATTATIQSVMAKVTDNIACKPCGERHARHILFKATDEKLANTVAKHLQADKGSDFAAYAKKYSTDTGSAKLGGDLGWFAQSAMVKEFGDAAFALKIGQVSKPVKSTYGWHVIQVLGERADSTQKSDYFGTWVSKQQKTEVKHVYVKL
jgi:parvulin-like peptidyl-prolyl isomerase